MKPGTSVYGPVPVLFRAVRSGEYEGEVTAIFPTMPAGPKLLTCYAHVGQHGAASPNWIAEATRPATPEEYAPLMAELGRIGYHVRVYKRMTPKHRDLYLRECRRVGL